MKVRKIVTLEIVVDEEELSVMLDGLRILEMDGNPTAKKMASVMRDELSDAYVAMAGR